jgi:cytochrome c5
MSLRSVSRWLLVGVTVWATLSLGGCPLQFDTQADPNAADPNAADPGNTTKSDLIETHLFKYDADAKEYVLGSRRIAEAEVRRDMYGALCGKCHAQIADELKASVHYRWAARNDNVLFPGGGAHGMIDRACGLPASTSLINFVSDVQLDECGKCHVGRYIPMVEQMLAGSFAQMGLADAEDQAARIVEGGIDCLICHARSTVPILRKARSARGIRARQMDNPRRRRLRAGGTRRHRLRWRR